ncbi:TRAP transporter substrate-binding protein DctP [Phenylobacterium sp.]|uniref:TRAP transporter substrate-binding protein DctP n=1 Tax=Phenylobacterium sp. TaxID=1871053 RepID=UPI003BA8C34B
MTGRKLIGMVVALMLLAACAPAKPAGGVEVLRYASPYSPNHPFSRADIIWMKHVERASGGRLKIQPFWGGALISSDQSVIELRHGVADIALITPIYMRSGMHVMKTQAGFYGGVRTIEDQVAVYRCLEQAFPIFGQEMAGVHVLAVQGGNLPNVLTRDKPVRGLADLRGLRLRAPGELTPVLQSLGVDVVTMPMGEVYSAISKGVVDGVVAPADAVKSLHFNEVARHLSLLQVSRGAYPARAISDARWRTLSPDLRQVLTEATPVWEAALAREIGKAEAEGMAMARTEGMSIVPVDPAEQARFDAAYDAEALRNARRLAEYGLPGEAIYRKARAVIAQGTPVKAC